MKQFFFLPPVTVKSSVSGTTYYLYFFHYLEIIISYSSCSETEQVNFKDFEWIIFILYWQNDILFIMLLYVEWLV